MPFGATGKKKVKLSLEVFQPEGVTLCVVVEVNADYADDGSSNASVSAEVALNAEGTTTAVRATWQ